MHADPRLDSRGVRGKVDYAARVIRDKRFKVWVDESARIAQLYDLRTDPLEQKNLVGTDDPAAMTAAAKFDRVIANMPAADARPEYRPRKANAWDRQP